MKAGDVVRLKSGGPDMTIGKITGGKAEVYWAPNGYAVMPVAILEKVKK